MSEWVQLFFLDIKAAAGMAPYKNLLRHDGSSAEGGAVCVCMYARAYILYVLGLNHCRVGCVEVKILRVNLYVYKELCGPAPCVV